jgi:hypothetical protein
MDITTLTPHQLRKAADIQVKILGLQDELNQLLGSSGPAPAQATEPRKKYTFSAAARAKMRAAQKARWAKIKGTAPSNEPVQKPKRKMTVAWRKALERAWVARRAKGKAAKSKA